MAESQSCAWGMSEDQRKEWNARAETCGFASVEQQERLGRIYDALYAALETAGYAMFDRQCYAERSAQTHHGTFTISQDAHRTQLNHLGSLGVNWYANGDFDPIIPQGLKVPHAMVKIIADALGKLA